MSRTATPLIAKLQQRLIVAPPLGVACGFVCVLAALLVFLLPYAVPVEFHPAISASYVAGFNNRAAAIAAACLSLAVLCWTWRRATLQRLSAESEGDPGGVEGWLVITAVLLSCASTALAAWFVHASGERYLGDAGYFIEQMSNHAEFGGALYSQLEFAYGPLLFYPTVALQAVLHCSMFAAYFITLAAEQTFGLLELAYVLRALPTRHADRRWAFILFVAGAITPLLGLNYTLFRYLTPVVLLLAIAKQERVGRSALALALGECVSLGISAEMGFGFAIASTALSLLKSQRNGVRWLLAPLGTVAGAAIFILTAGRGYFHMLGAFAKGGMNLPVAPYPHLLVFLFAVVWLAPLAAGRVLAASHENRYSLAACYAFGIALLPSALGRCDPLHVFFVGSALCLLSLCGASNASAALRRLWAACLLLLVGWQMFTTNRVFRTRTADTLAEVLPPQANARIARLLGPESALGSHFVSDGEEDYLLDTARLERSIGTAAVAVPLDVLPDIERALKRTHHYRPSYFAFTVDTFSQAAEQRKIEEMNESEWALVPGEYPAPLIELPTNLQDLQGMSMPLPTRNPIPFHAGVAMAANLKDNWTTVDHLGPYLLLKRRR